MSSLTRLDIYNMALGHVGTRMLASEREATPEAVQCNLFYDRARRAAIRDYPYPFCRRRVRLCRIAMPEEYADDWRYAYAMPEEALKIIRIGNCEDYEIGRLKTGLAIFCNAESPIALCAVDAPNPSEWDELFAEALSYRLALFIATPLLKNNPGKIQELAQLYANIEPALQGHAASEEREGKPALDDWQGEVWLMAREGW